MINTSVINSQILTQQQDLANVAPTAKISQVTESKLRQLNEVKKSSPDRQLHVVAISKGRSRIMMITANVWQKQAKEMGTFPQNIKHTEILWDSAAISFIVSNQLKNLSTTYEYYACFSNNNIPHGMVILNVTIPDELVVSFLVTNPADLRCPGNPKNRQIYGSGTLLMEFAMERAAELGKKKISLSPSTTSRSFYIQKLGFTLSDDCDDDCEFLEKCIT